jgi:hypothetical protein
MVLFVNRIPILCVLRVLRCYGDEHRFEFAVGEDCCRRRQLLKVHLQMEMEVWKRPG